MRTTRRPPSRKNRILGARCAMAGFETRKPRSREGHKVKREAAAEKRRRGRVGTTGVLAAAARSSLRAKGPKEMEIVQTTLQAVDVTTQNRLADWSNRENPVDVLRDEIDPQYGRAYALQTEALRTDRPLEQVSAAVAESEAGTAANVASRKTRAALRKERGFSKTYTLKDGGRQKIVRTGAQVKKKEQRDRKLRALPPPLRPSYKSQTLAPGIGLIRYKATGKANGSVRLHPETKRSRAEIVAGALRVTPIGRGRYQFAIPSGWKDYALVRMGFRPCSKPTRNFVFKGPTAKADARAFDKKLMGWLKKWKKGVGPPPKP